jgi:hypothetical protein
MEVKWEAGALPLFGPCAGVFSRAAAVAAGAAVRSPLVRCRGSAGTAVPEPEAGSLGVAAVAESAAAVLPRGVSGGVGAGGGESRGLALEKGFAVAPGKLSGAPFGVGAGGGGAGAGGGVEAGAPFGAGAGGGGVGAGGGAEAGGGGGGWQAWQ